MSDLIRREDAIKAIWGDDINPSEDGMVFEAQSHIDRDIRLIPSADRPQGWIPCSERMPSNDDKVVLATVVDGHRVILMLPVDVERFYLKGYVSAWMPSPKPWKGADDE